VDATSAEIESEMKGKDCPICYTARIAMRIPRDESKRRYENPGDLFFIDAWGECNVPGLNNERFALFIVDDVTKFT